jgi:hypothetical protein
VLQVFGWKPEEYANGSMPQEMLDLGADTTPGNIHLTCEGEVSTLDSGFLSTAMLGQCFVLVSGVT